MPHREVMDGVLVIFGGAFLITPGFITDVFGVLLLLPPTRAIVRRLIVERLGRRVTVRVAGAAAGPRDYDVEGTRQRVRRCRPGGSSGERARARRRLLRPRPRALRERALGRDRALRGPPPDGPPGGPAGGGRGRRLERAAAGTARRSSSSRVAPEADLGGVAATVCTVRGEVAGKRVDGLGTVAETRSLPAWDELDALRTISALADEQHAAGRAGRRPRGAARPRRGES